MSPRSDFRRSEKKSLTSKKDVDRITQESYVAGNKKEAGTDEEGTQEENREAQTALPDHWFRRRGAGSPPFAFIPGADWKALLTQPAQPIPGAEAEDPAAEGSEGGMIRISSRRDASSAEARARDQLALIAEIERRELARLIPIARERREASLSSAGLSIDRLRCPNCGFPEEGYRDARPSASPAARRPERRTSRATSSTREPTGSRPESDPWRPTMRTRGQRFLARLFHCLTALRRVFRPHSNAACGHAAESAVSGWSACWPRPQEKRAVPRPDSTAYESDAQ